MPSSRRDFGRGASAERRRGFARTAEGRRGEAVFVAARVSAWRFPQRGHGLTAAGYEGVLRGGRCRGPSCETLCWQTVKSHLWFKTGPMSSPSSNRLSREKSPYLLQHKNNPVDWFPWGEEAFAKARKEDKPVFLSGGLLDLPLVPRHGARVVRVGRDRRVPERAFVSIKVDREERPRCRPGLHDLHPSHDRPRRLADERLGSPRSSSRSRAAPTFRRPTCPVGPGFITVLRRIAEFVAERPQADRGRRRNRCSPPCATRETEVITPGSDEWDLSKSLHLALSQYSRMFDTKEGRLRQRARNSRGR